MRWDNVNWLTPGGRLCYGSVTAERGRFTRHAIRWERPRPGADILLPGLVDLHTHAMVGHDYADPDLEEGARGMRALAQAGTTAFLFATMAQPEEELAAQCGVIRAARARQARGEGPGEARCLGVYLEGPFLSPEKKGAHRLDCLRLPDPGLLEELDQLSGGAIRVVCVAPELAGALTLAGALAHAQGHKGGRVISLAHSAADYDLACAAFDGGFSHVTHLFNAMEPFLHRAPGPVGAAAERRTVTVELIGDGIHVHPSAVRAAFALFGPERLCLISDSIAVCGLPDGVYSTGGQSIAGQLIALKDGRATVAGTDTIAGAAVPLLEGLRRVAGFGVPLEEAATAATHTPARRLGLDGEIGVIAPGARADALLLSPGLELKALWLGGREQK